MVGCVRVPTVNNLAGNIFRHSHARNNCLILNIVPAIHRFAEFPERIPQTKRMAHARPRQTPVRAASTTSRSISRFISPACAAGEVIYTCRYSPKRRGDGRKNRFSAQNRRRRCGWSASNGCSCSWPMPALHQKPHKIRLNQVATHSLKPTRSRPGRQRPVKKRPKFQDRFGGVFAPPGCIRPPLTVPVPEA